MVEAQCELFALTPSRSSRWGVALRTVASSALLVVSTVPAAVREMATGRGRTTPTVELPALLRAKLRLR